MATNMVCVYNKQLYVICTWQCMHTSSFPGLVTCSYIDIVELNIITTSYQNCMNHTMKR